MIATSLNYKYFKQSAEKTSCHGKLRPNSLRNNNNKLQGACTTDNSDQVMWLDKRHSMSADVEQPTTELGLLTFCINPLNWRSGH